jgi:predicted ester cyclase
VQKNIFKNFSNAEFDFFLRNKFNKLYIPQQIFLTFKKGGHMNPKDFQKLNEEIIDCWNKHDVKKFLTYLDDGIVWQDTASPEPFTGKAGAEQFFLGWDTAFPDFKMKVLNTVISGDDIAVELQFSGTNTGPLRMGEHEIPATNRKVVNKGSYFSKLKGEKVIAIHSYPDLAGMMVQLGLQETHETHA